MNKKTGQMGKIKHFLFFPLLSRITSVNIRRIVYFCLCVMLIMALSSCWSKRELNSLAIVLGVALDLGEEPDSIMMTSQVIKPTSIISGESSSTGQQGEKPYLNIQYTDKSVYSILQHLTRRLNRDMYFSHNKVVILSSDLAKKETSKNLDAFMRNFETRLNVLVAVSKGKAADVLDEQLEFELLPSVHISEMLENQQSALETVAVTMRDFSITTMSESTAPVAPLVDFYRHEEKIKSRVEGSAVFKKGKMIGELDTKETRGLIWTMQKTKRGYITVESEWGQVAVEITSTACALKPVVSEDGKASIELRIEADGYVVGNETTENLSTVENIEVIKGLMYEYILSDIDAAFSRAKLLSADIFGFGEAIRREHPKVWESMKENWDNEFKTIELNPKIDIELKCNGNLRNPVIPGGGK